MKNIQKKMQLAAMLSMAVVTVSLTACGGNEKPSAGEGNVIHLAEALKNPVKVNLSELVDSIKYVPLSTKEHFIRDPRLIFYSKPYVIAFPGCIYNSKENL